MNNITDELRLKKELSALDKQIKHMEIIQDTVIIVVFVLFVSILVLYGYNIIGAIK